MSSYTEDHADALADVAEAGAAITFTLARPGVEDPATGTFGSGSVSIVTGQATDAGKDNLTRYLALNLVVAKARTLFFVPDTLGELPELDSSATWGDATYVVKDIKPYEPNGVALFAEIIVEGGGPTVAADVLFTDDTDDVAAVFTDDDGSPFGDD